MLQGKTVILGVTGSIAAYKAASLASALAKLRCDVQVILTKNAAQFITPLTFEELTGNRCITDTFDRNFTRSVEHVALAKRADLAIVAPATANVIAKLAHGLADDMLTTTLLACRCPKLVAPAMNTAMLEAPVTGDNLALLRRYGYRIIEPATGVLACKAVGAGKLPEPEALLSHILLEIGRPHDLSGRRVLVTAGPTEEPLDPVRHLTNRSTGKMGYALAKVCAERGAEVTLVTGPCALPAPLGVTAVPVRTAAEMFDAVTSRAEAQDFLFLAAAVADYTPEATAPEKLKKGDAPFLLPLARTRDILQYLGAHKSPRQFLCGFAMETERLLERAREKRARKGADMIAANSLRDAGAGFGTDTNVMTLISPAREEALPLLSKEETADRIVSFALEEQARRA